MSIDQKCLDRLRQAIGNDEAGLIELIQSFIEDGPALLAELRSANDASDVALLKRISHSLLSNARDFGALELADVCARLEHDSGNAGTSSISADIAIAGRALSQALAELGTLVVPGGGR